MRVQPMPPAQPGQTSTKGPRRARWLAHLAVLAAALGAAAPATAQDGAAPARAPSRAVRAVDQVRAPVAEPQTTGAAAQSGRETVTLLIDRAKVVRLPERVQTVIVGNPLIADVALQRNGVAVLTGKSYGVTNLIALDATGAMLAESLVNVQAPTETVVTVQRGLERETWSCNPHCQRSLLLGDSNTYFSEVGAQAERRNALATGR